MARAALFDMDRTLVRKETASLYVKYQRRIGEATTRDLLKVSFWALQYTLGILDVATVAERVVATYRGTPEDSLTKKCETWFQSDVLPHVCDKGRTAVKKHRESGDLIAIVTGASPYATRPLASLLGIEHIVTSRFQVSAEGNLTGKVEHPLCFGHGKLVRARAFAKEQGFRLEDAVFYTDSITDLPLLEACGDRVCVNPDPRLRRLARTRGWAIERW
jgi:HAD superfamily hydrolase (TIGR01490 family)